MFEQVAASPNQFCSTSFKMFFRLFCSGSSTFVFCVISVSLLLLCSMLCVVRRLIVVLDVVTMVL